MEQQHHRGIHSFVRRGGRMTAAREKAYGDYMPKWGVSFTGRLLDFSSLFPGKRDIILEIGFGMGDATLEIARKRLNTGFLAIEVHHPGIARLLSEIEREGLDNIRVMEHDAVEVLDGMIPGDSLGGIHIFFPDPWPKKKHHKRRLIQPAFVEKVVSRLKTGGYIYTATDWEPYAEQMKEVFAENDSLENPYGGFARDINWRPGTRFEKKGREKGYPVRELFVTKRGLE